jgi:hypothetical protein
MGDAWYYAAGADPIGPFTLQELANELRKLPSLNAILVWRHGGSDWLRIEEIPELASLGTLAPPRAARKLEKAGAKRRGPETFVQLSGEWQGRLMRMLPFAGGAVLVAICGIVASYAYSNSALGWGYITGLAPAVSLVCFVGIRAIARGLPKPVTYFAALSLAGAIILVINWGGLLRANEATQAKRILANRTSVEAIQNAAREHPSNRSVRLMADVARVAQETQKRVEQLFAGIEPARLAQEPDLPTASKAQLIEYRDDLRAAEANSKTAVSKFTELLAEEQGALQTSLASYQTAGVVSATLKGVERRHVVAREFGARRLGALTELYASYGRLLDVLIREHGRVQFTGDAARFDNDKAVADWNAAAADLAAARERAEQTEREGENLKQQYERRLKDFLSSN